LSSRFHLRYNGSVRKLLKNFANDESGQALIEFFLLLLVIVTIVGSMKNGLRWLTVKLWQFMARKIAAPCPSCDAGLEFDLTH
jgi:Flp pilus assembly pilin Flp